MLRGLRRGNMYLFGVSRESMMRMPIVVHLNTMEVLHIPILSIENSKRNSYGCVFREEITGNGHFPPWLEKPILFHLN